VDEPREKGVNPWNRNYDDTVKYLTMLRKIDGLVLAENPMEDVDHYVNKSYLGFLDYVDVLSTHPWKQSARFMKETQAKGRTLWLYNGGMDRFSWGFYQWRTGATGRWEWHTCFAGDWTWEYYPGHDWYLPYTDSNGFGPAAPYTDFRGGMAYRSVFLEAMEGMNDYAFLYTLREAVKANKAAGTNAKTVEEAQAFLDGLPGKIPEFPKIRGLTTGAGVGQGIADEAAKSTDSWRRQIAGYLKELMKK
jgi:hypothetical protein